MKYWFLFLAIFLVGCKATSEVSLEEFEACESEECKYNIAVKIGYVEYCYDLPDEGERNEIECITLIAEAKHDAKLCSYIKDELKESLCYYRAAEKNDNITICTSIRIEDERVRCINDFAVRHDEYGYCDYFYNDTKDIANIGFNRDMCVYNLITVNGNTTLCKKINSLQVKQEKLCR